MSALSIQVPFPVFQDRDGQPLEAGYVWIGTVNLDPQVNPIGVYWDAALTIAAVQPIRTLSGYPSNSGMPARLYVDSDYSIRVMNKNGSVVYSAPAATERYSNVVIGINASTVIYDPAGTGAVATTVQGKLRESVSIEDFGAVGDGVTDDSAAFIACLKSNPSLTGFDVQLSAKSYRISSAALYFTRRIRFFGISRNVTTLDFRDSSVVSNSPYNAHITVVHSNNITGSSSSANPITLPAGWVGTYGEMSGFFDLTVRCNSSVTDGIGIFYNVAANSSNILVRDANLHNIAVVGSSTNLLTRGDTVGASGVDIGGNSNNGVYINIKTQFSVNGDGIHVNGSDANANLFLHPDSSSNKGWGMNDASLLGNTYVQGHTAANAYGAYRSRPASTNRSTYISPYSEGSQGVDNANTVFEMNARAIILGAQGVSPSGNFRAITAETLGLQARSNLIIAQDTSYLSNGDPYSYLQPGEVEIKTTDGKVLEIKRISSSYTGISYDSITSISFHNTGSGAITIGRPYFPSGFALGTSHSQTVSATIPTTGTGIRGQIVWNTSPVAGDYVGWVCTTSGTPGTWKTFGAVSA
jgi:hypothetical protein